jgi:putative transposase
MGYQSDLSDTEWRIIYPFLPKAKRGGRPRTTDSRAVVNAIFYVLRSGCSWRLLPQDFPPYQTVYMYFKQWEKDGVWDKVHDVLRNRVRKREGRKKSPSAAIVDSQSVKTTEKGALAAMTPERR